MSQVSTVHARGSLLLAAGCPRLVTRPDVLGESAISPAISGDDGSINRRGIDNFAGNDPTPDEVAILSEEFKRLIHQLDDPQLQKVAVAAMQGYSNDEIAKQLNCAVRTVERRRELIRKKWMRELSL